MLNPLFSPKTGKSRLFSNLNGFIVIDKPKNWTSFDVVAKIRNRLNPKKIGHAGTLDPLATGVLVLCLGQGTKLSEKVMGTDKEYVGEITLGAVSDTDDAQGPVVPNEKATERPITEVENVLQSFVGTFDQMPPKFSAKKIDGDRAYKLARKGKEVKLEPAQVTVKQIELLDYKWPKIKLRVVSGKGFYVRSLARDVGEKLGVGGYLSDLKRTRVGTFSIERAVTVEEASEKSLIPLSAAGVR
jgi:tRNA pseudouridine55 synthase